MRNPVEWANAHLTPYGPGKFSLMVDAVAYDYTLDGTTDDSRGDANESDGWYGVAFLTDLAAHAKLDAELWARLSPADVIFLQAHDGGFILREDSNGFVDVDFYRDDEDARRVWANIARSFDVEEAVEGETR